MDWFTLISYAFVLFILTCIAVILYGDSDLMTFLAERYGKKPVEEFNGKVVWLTGASSGIGEALAKDLAKCNSKLVLTARREDELNRVKKECLSLNRRLTDHDILVLPLDMVNLEQHEPSFKKILDHFGKLDLLISNAGRSQRAAWSEIDIEVDKQMFELNVFSVINMNRIVLRHFLKIGSGHLAVVSSLGGRFGMPHAGSYSGTKHALQGYFAGLRNELAGTKIEITMILPGPVESNISNAAFSTKVDTAPENPNMGPSKRMTPERCSKLALIAMANGVGESWMALRPFIPMLYLLTYQPYLSAKLFKFLMARFGPKLKK